MFTVEVYGASMQLLPHRLPSQVDFCQRVFTVSLPGKMVRLQFEKVLQVPLTSRNM